MEDEMAEEMEEKKTSTQRNIFGKPLIPCSFEPMTGFFRSGCCETDEMDRGSHTVCVQVTQEFLWFSKRAGNDLSTPRPEFGFVGLKPGDRWCVCAPRWKEAYDAGFAAPVILESCHHGALQYVSMQELEEYALKPN